MRIFLQQAAVLLSFFLLSLSKQHTKGSAVFLEEFSQDDSSTFGVQLYQRDHQQVVMSNGIVNVTLAVPGGYVADITYKGSENLLEAQYVKADDRGHWDIIWSRPGNVNPVVDKLLGTSYKIIKHDKYQTEISFTRTWTFSSKESPLNIDKRYVMLAGSPGFYTYTVLERLKGWPAFDVHEGRIVFKLRQNKFEYMAMSEERQRYMPTDRDHSRGQTLDYKEAVQLTNPTNPDFNGEVDDKYLYSSDNKDSLVHGWVSNDGVGFWIITPSNEFRMGGPFKQDLTTHVGPVALSMFISLHYAGYDQALKFGQEEDWKKVFGPVYVYLNSAAPNSNPSILWNDAKRRMKKEVSDWPYNFPLSKDFFKSNRRGSISGKFLVHDSFVNKRAVPGASAYVGLAPPGAAGSWQLEGKGYQFWTQTDKKGNFMIKNVIAGTYSLFAWHHGTLGDYKHVSDITINPGSSFKINNMIFEAPRKGTTLWEIGVPDRKAADFFIPDPPKQFKIHQYSRPIEKFRQYGLWARYNDLYSEGDLVFTVGVSDYRKHWFFAHVTRNLGDDQYASTTWTIEFDLKEVNKGAHYTLQLALASANGAELQVRVNDPRKPAPNFSTGLIGKDNALARHGIHGIYRFYSIEIEGSLLVVGRNNICLRQARDGKFTHVMYDYIRLEGPHASKF